MIHGVDEQTIERALEFYLSNSHWERYYTDAPTDKCRQFITYQFVDSMICFLSVENEELGEKARNIMIQTEKKLTILDWQYLLKYCGNNPRYPYIVEMIKSLEAGERPHYRQIGFELLNPFYQET